MKESVVAKFATTAVYGKVFWRKVLDIYATSIDYDSQTEMAKLIFTTVQNKMHWAGAPRTEKTAIRDNN
ncbi:MAG: virulence RhuM family protein [Methanosarcinales archaeon]|nr:virulence RhuM family protein [Methanosarcinales archaeon]